MRRSAARPRGARGGVQPGPFRHEPPGGPPGWPQGAFPCGHPGGLPGSSAGKGLAGRLQPPSAVHRCSGPDLGPRGDQVAPGNPEAGRPGVCARGRAAHGYGLGPGHRTRRAQAPHRSAAMFLGRDRGPKGPSARSQDLARADPHRPTAPALTRSTGSHGRRPPGTATRSWQVTSVGHPPAQSPTLSHHCALRPPPVSTTPHDAQAAPLAGQRQAATRDERNRDEPSRKRTLSHDSDSAGNPPRTHLAGAATIEAAPSQSRGNGADLPRPHLRTRALLAPCGTPTSRTRNRNHRFGGSPPARAVAQGPHRQTPTDGHLPAWVPAPVPRPTTHTAPPTNRFTPGHCVPISPPPRHNRSPIA